MRRAIRTTLLVGCAMLLASAAGHAQEQGPDEAAIRAVVQAQADAFNRGDLEATMATLAPGVDWRTIQTEMIEGHAAVTESMGMWMEGMRSNDVRLVYPEDQVRVRLLSADHAVVDVVLTWDVGDRPPLGETLFFVLSRVDGDWVIRHVRNTTTHPCAAQERCEG